ncbi:sugar ABC transporter substrate-binding protein [Cyanobacterium sp. Dongsha4]|uniref:ABC transporter substrate-binding protein n=1 Tax=Cyanobacterium sp. DS4 TaxID=2878255 RepID=UPI002E819C00|nr:sugar ABC transporter substrate-binding protein [Cyanobacterium sp. Dongsha4]WVL01164.1 sugar ABC transporter substrate-binding protein [Cyanobacterium sp. Dongsha4]
MFLSLFGSRLQSLFVYLSWFIAGLLLTFLVSCTTSGSNSAESIEFWTMQLQPQFTNYFQELNSSFEQDNPPSKVDWIDVPWNAMESKILTAVSAKTAPDVVNLNPDFASQLASRNAWLNLDTQIPSEVKDKYLGKIWDGNSINLCNAENQCEKIIFGIPWYLTTTITVYNEDLLNQAGVSQPPKTFADLAVVAQQVKEKTGKYAFFVPLVANDSNEVLQSFVQMGVSLLDENGKAAFNTPEGLKVFQYWVDLYQRDLLPPEILTQGHRHAIELYQAGELALLGTGAEFLKTIATNAPTIYEKSNVTSQITGDTGKKNVAVMNLVIPKDTDKSEEALKYALFVTNGENQLKFTQQANVLPSHKDAIASYISSLEKENSNDILIQGRKISAQQLEEAEVLIPPVKNIGQLKKIIYDSIQQAMLGEKTVEQAIKDAANQWDNSTQS